MNSKINILITGAGAPGILGTIYSLKNNYDNRKIHITTTDINSEVIGKYLSDNFFIIPSANKNKEYFEAILNLCKKQNIDVIIPQNTAELVFLSSKKRILEKIGVKVLLSDEKALEVANDKYELMKLCLKSNIPVAKFQLVNNFNELRSAAQELGWPDNKVVVKPPSSNGSRGVRIIDEKINLKESFFQDKPTSLFIKMDSLYEVLGDNFPQLLVMEYLPGKEYSVDVLRKSEYNIIVPRSRDLVRSGITFNGSLEKNDQIIEYSNIVAEKLNLEYCFGFQYKLDAKGIPKIIESNPRVQGTMIMSTLAGVNIIYSSVKLLLGEKLPKFEIDWTSKFYRYWGGLSVNKNEIKPLGF